MLKQDNGDLFCFILFGVKIFFSFFQNFTELHWTIIHSVHVHSD